MGILNLKTKETTKLEDWVIFSMRKEVNELEIFEKFFEENNITREMILDKQYEIGKYLKSKFEAKTIDISELDELQTKIDLWRPLINYLRTLNISRQQLMLYKEEIKDNIKWD